jgi:hypothetical protein
MNEEDRIFAETIAKEFDLPVTGITHVVNYIRGWKKAKGNMKDIPSIARIRNSDLIRIVDFKDCNPTGIHIETQGDYIHLSSEDPLFPYFKTAIKRMVNAFRKEIIEADKKATKELNELMERQIFISLIRYFKDRKIVQFYQRAIIGLFLVHFGINDRKPILTPEKWDFKTSSADNYYDYLNNMVKYRHKKYLRK